MESIKNELLLRYKNRGVHTEDLIDTNLSIDSLRLILRYRAKNINIKPYVLMCQSDKHLHVLDYCILHDKKYYPNCEGKYNLLSAMKKYIKQSYSSDKLLEIAKGLKNNIDVTEYHNRRLSLKEMKNIRLKLESNMVNNTYVSYR